jgi:uncharacterized membrane protein
MAIAAAIMALTTIIIDNALGSEWASGDILLFVNTAANAREIMGIIASSTITVTGTVFSLTMVVLSLTSQQNGPLSLENFLRDRVTQAVLGTFTATFIYSLLVLRTIDERREEAFVPVISSAVGLILVLISLAVLIYFIHHISSSIHPATIVARISDTLDETIGSNFPALEQSAPVNVTVAHRYVHASAIIRATGRGYIQFINDEWLVEVAKRHDVVIQLDMRPGHFIMKGLPLGTVYGTDAPDEDLIDGINEALPLGRRRTQAEDVEYIMRQISSMAVRALSPAVNAPYTAMMCSDHLLRGLRKLANYPMQAAYHRDSQDVIRVIRPGLDYDEAVRVAFDQIRYYAAENPDVLIHLMHGLSDVARSIDDPIKRTVLQTYMDKVYRTCSESARATWGAKEYDEVYDLVVQEFEAIG